MIKTDWKLAERSLCTRLAASFGEPYDLTREQLEDVLLEEPPELELFDSLKDIAEQLGADALQPFLDDPDIDSGTGLKIVLAAGCKSITMIDRTLIQTEDADRHMVRDAIRDGLA